jgi:hypothetical protein
VTKYIIVIYTILVEEKQRIKINTFKQIQKNYIKHITLQNTIIFTVHLVQSNMY